MRTPFRSLLADQSLAPSLTAPRYRVFPSAADSIHNAIQARPARSWFGLPSLRSRCRDLLAAGVLLLLSLQSPARAEILFSDDFSRPDGPIVELPGTPWRTLFGTPAQIRTAGGSLRLDEGTPEWVEAPLAGQPITNRPVYAGFTATVSALPSGDSYQFFAAFSIVNGPRPLSRVVITTQGAAPGKFRIGVTHGLTGTGGVPAPTGIIAVDLSLNTPFRLVLRQGLPSPLSTVWVNPTTEEGGADNSDEGTFLPASIVGFMFRQRLVDGQGMGTVTVDDLVVATTFDEVKSEPVPPPPTERRLLGRWPALPRVRPDGLTAHEGYLYVPSLSGLRVFDIRDPANRQQVMVPEAPQITRGPLVVAGNRAYSAGYGLSVLDVSTPANPRMLGFLPVTEISGNDIAVADQHVFILDHGYFYPPFSTDPNPAGLYIVDASDPAQPRKVSFLNTTASYTGLIVSAGYAYAKLGNGPGSDIFDVRDPMKPTLVGNFPSYLLAASGQRAYVSSSEGRLQIFDFSDPTNPVLLGTESTGSGGHDRMRLDGDLAYVTGGTSLFIYDISNPAVPRRIGRSDGGVTWFGGFTVWNKRAFFTGRSTLNVFDATDPTKPRLEIFDPNDLAARVRNPFEDAFGDATDVALDGGYAFVADPTGGLHVIDVSDSARPRRVASVGTNAVHVSVNNGYAYVRKGITYDASSEALEIYDVREPRTPRLLKSVILPTSQSSSSYDDILGVHVSGKHCYVGSQRDGLMVFDVSLPANPRQLGKISGGVSRMVTSGNYLFSLRWVYGGCPIFDIRNPSQPRLIGYGEPIIANDVAVSGNQAFWAHTSGVLVDNVSNPARPVRLGKLSDASAATALAASRSHLYVAADDKALTVYALNPSGVPTAVSSTTNQYRYINRLRQAGGKLFATVRGAKDGGLLIFSDPFAPAPPTLSGIRRDASGGVRLTLTGAAGSPFTLERSTNLLRWENWIEGTLQETNAAGREFLDDSTSRSPYQFYRARPQ